MGSAGSLPSLRTGTNPAPKANASVGANMKPRASMPNTASTGPIGPAASTSARLIRRNTSGSRHNGVMSRNVTPATGQSGIWRTLSSISCSMLMNHTTYSATDIRQFNIACVACMLDDVISGGLDLLRRDLFAVAITAEVKISAEHGAERVPVFFNLIWSALAGILDRGCGLIHCFGDVLLVGVLNRLGLGLKL